MSKTVTRLAIVVSHPIQYLVPLYRQLTRRDDLKLKVFFTWHAAGRPVEDRGFGMAFAWDIPLAQGFDGELVPNVSGDPGTHHFFGLCNPALVERVVAWRPDVVQMTGWAWRSHLQALHALNRRGICTLFRGDSHLMDGELRHRRWIKQAVLRRVYSWPTAFLVAGSANRAYYRRFGVPAERLHACPPCIEVDRFAEPAGELERVAACWRQELGISPEQIVVLYAGKFEPRKQPLQLMHAVRTLNHPNLVIVLVGAGELQPQIDRTAADDPSRFRVLPFQNQSRMPIVYRLADLVALPSGYGETWGLAVNEALACGRPVLVSDRAGCAADVVTPDCGRTFRVDASDDLERTLGAMIAHRDILAGMRRAASARARSFDISVTAAATMTAIDQACTP
jgi:glycosyltransferase involved in cell wall biosynthesis